MHLSETRHNKKNDCRLSRTQVNGFHQQKQVAKDGGSVAKAARTQLESKLGHGVITQDKASDYLPNIEDNDE